MKKFLLLTISIYFIVNGLNAQVLSPIIWESQAISISFPESFEAEEITSTSVYGYSDDHEISIEEINDPNFLQPNFQTFFKNEYKRFGFIKAGTISNLTVGNYSIQYTYGATEGLEDMFIAIITSSVSKKQYSLYVSMGQDSEKVGLEILKSLK